MPTPLCVAAEQAARLSTTQWSDGSLTMNRAAVVVIRENDLDRVGGGFSQTGSDIPGYALVEREAAKAARPAVAIVWDPWLGLAPEATVTGAPRMPAGCPSAVVVDVLTPVPEGSPPVALGPPTLQPASFWRFDNPLAWIALGVPLVGLGALVWWQGNR